MNYTTLHGLLRKAGLDINLFKFILKKVTIIAMDKDLAQEAISAALTGNWDEAIKINQKILRDDPKSIDALNRLARAHAEIGEVTRARDISQKVLKIDPFNSIATKANEKWKILKKGEISPSKPSSPEAFLEEPGKTKILPLLHIGDSQVLAKLDAGDEVNLNIHAHRASITTTDGKYVGRLPDDLSARLRSLIKYGNEYQVFIKSSDKAEVKIFIREVRRSKKLSDIPSFAAEKIEYISFTPPELVHKKEHLGEPEDEEE